MVVEVEAKGKGVEVWRPRSLDRKGWKAEVEIRFVGFGSGSAGDPCM